MKTASYTVRVVWAVCAILLIALATRPCMGQKTDNDLGDETIVIDKGYKPTLAEGEKISNAPRNDTSLVQTPVMKYEVKNVKSETKYIINPVKPLRVRDEYIKELYHGFVKAGYGFPSLPFAEITYNSLRSKEFDAGFHYSHLSSKGTIKEFGYPGFSNNRLAVNGTRYFESADLNAKIAYERDLYHFYGYDAESIFFEKQETRNIFNTLNTGLTLKSRSDDADAVKYKVGLNYMNAKNNRAVTENTFTILSTLEKNVGVGIFGGDIAATFDKIEQEQSSQTNTLITLSPKYTLRMLPWKITAGVDINVISEFDQTEVHFFPRVKFDYQLSEGRIVAYGELGNGFIQNKYYDVSHENPFIDNRNVFHSTHILFSGLLGINAMIDKDFQFHANYEYKKNNGHLFFMNKEKNPVMFSTIYLDDQISKLHGDVEYGMSKKLSATLGVDYASYTFENDSLLPLYKPAVRTAFSIGYKLQDKISLRSTLYINSKSNYWDYSKGGYGYLKSWIDINMYGEYRYTKLLAFFVDINNVGFSKYQRFYNYPVFPFNAMAGFSYSF